MKRLILFRHGKSDWSSAATRDFDRPINERGQQGSRVMGKWLRRNNIGFDRILASPAVRVAETIEEAAPEWGSATLPEWDRRIYLASSVTLMDVLRDTDGDPAAILMVGHNPGMEDLIFDLVPDSPPDDLRARVEEKFPTAAIAVIDMDIASWGEIDNGVGKLVHLVFPRDLDPALAPQPSH